MAEYDDEDQGVSAETCKMWRSIVQFPYHARVLLPTYPYVSLRIRMAAGLFRPFTVPLLVALLGGCAYGITLAPTISWAHDAADSAELAAAWVFGVPHPTGYPLWLLLAVVIVHVPIG